MVYIRTPDLISICETSLNDSIKLPDILLNDYTFVQSRNSTNTRHGGVGLFYTNSLPIKIRNDLSFDESIVVELKFGRKFFFFTVLYRSPASNHNSPEFMDFLSNFNNLYTNIKNENPFAIFFTGDFNGHSQLRWPDGDTTAEGREIENLISSLGLSQLISEPTNFDPNKNPSCIDLIITHQPNLVLDSGTRASLDSFCHHQITYCKVNFNIPPPSPLLKTIDQYLSFLFVGKCLEKSAFSYFYDHLTTHHLITKNQSGFRPGDSTTNQLIDIVNEIHHAFDNTKSLEVRAIFLDISKAFDKVWHDGLIFKMRQNGVSGQLLKLFQDYLKNRNQHVVLNGFPADYSTIESGVPPGVCSGPPIISDLY